jgi:hypothetical protein
MFGTRKTYIFAAILVAAMPIAPAWSRTHATYATMHAGEPALAPENGRIYFYRDSGFVGFALQPSIRLNDDVVGDSEPGHYFYVDRPAGTYTVTTRTEKSETVSATVVPGQSLYVRTDVSMGFLVGHVIPSLIMPEQAQSEISDCDYVGPAQTPAPAATADAAAPAAPPAMAQGDAQMTPTAAASPATTPTAAPATTP